MLSLTDQHSKPVWFSAVVVTAVTLIEPSPGLDGPVGIGPAAPAVGDAVAELLILAAPEVEDEREALDERLGAADDAEVAVGLEVRVDERDDSGAWGRAATPATARAEARSTLEKDLSIVVRVEGRFRASVVERTAACAKTVFIYPKMYSPPASD